MSQYFRTLDLTPLLFFAVFLAVASGDCLRAFAEYENAMRPFVEANQALGLRSSKIMRSGERKSVLGWHLKQLMRIMPGPVTEWIINRSTERITQVANAICLKDYSSFLRSKEAPAGRPGLRSVTSHFSLLTFLTSAVGYFRLTDFSLLHAPNSWRQRMSNAWDVALLYIR